MITISDINRGQSDVICDPHLCRSDGTVSSRTPPSQPTHDVLPPSVRDALPAAAHRPTARSSSVTGDDLSSPMEACCHPGDDVNSRLTYSVNNW